MQVALAEQGGAVKDSMQVKMEERKQASTGLTVKLGEMR